MRKLFILLLCTTTLGLVSCKKDTIIQETRGKTFNYTIPVSSWTTADGGLTWSAVLNVSAIDNITVDDEGVLVYITHPELSSSYLQIPATWNSHSYTYELYDGGIQIDLQSSDVEFDKPNKPTAPILVKIVVIPSEYVGN